MGRPTTKTINVSGAQATASGFIPINHYAPDISVKWVVKRVSGNSPVTRVEATLKEVLASGSVSSTDVYEITSAAAGSAAGIIANGNLSNEVPAAVRFRTVSGGSAASVLEFTVLQTSV